MGGGVWERVSIIVTDRSPQAAGLSQSAGCILDDAAKQGRNVERVRSAVPDTATRELASAAFASRQHRPKPIRQEPEPHRRCLGDAIG